MSGRYRFVCRLRSDASIALIAMLIVFAPRHAAAQLTENRSIPVERLRISLDRQGVQAAESGTVLPFLSWDTGLWLNHADDPLVVYDLDTGKRIAALVHSRLDGALMATVGVWKIVQVGAEIPFIAYQDRSGSIQHTTGTAVLASLSNLGFGDVRIVPKIQLLEAEEVGVDFAILPTFTVPSGMAKDYRGNKGPTFGPELAASRSLGNVKLAANLGYLLRKNQSMLNQEVADEILYRAGVGYQVPFGPERGSPVEVDALVSGGVAAAAPWKNSNQSPLEIVLQGNYDLGPVLVFAGTSFGLSRGFGTPDWRAFAGVRLGMVDDDIDNDGIKNVDDKCPTEPGPKDNLGCPETDRDHDGLIDRLDKCPDEPEDKDGFQDDDGCPDLDHDGDGVLDVDDKCPNEPGPKENQGCPDVDTDRDGLVDRLDSCPAEPGPRENNGCPDVDTDGDGLVDRLDKCPKEPGPLTNAGCPEPDRDADEVIDRLDNCPDEPGTIENHGCKAKQLVTITADRIEILDRVYFKTAMAVIETRSYPLLENVAQVVLAHPEVGMVSVEGHTDDRGSAEYNTKLSQDRANSVVAFLVKKGVPAERLIGKGFGPTKPIESNKTERGRANNRRVEFNLLGAEGSIQKGANEAADDTMEKR